MLPVRHARFAFAATLVVAFSLLIVFSPTVGAEQRREQRDGSSEKTPTPVVAEFVVAQPEETPEPEPADELAVEPSEPDPSPSPSTLVASGGDDNDTAVAVVAGGGDDVNTDLAVQSGTVTVHAEFCPLGPNGIDYANSSLAELLDACQEPGSTEFTLDLGWWSGAQTTGDVIADGVFWEPALGPDPISIIGPDEDLNSGHGQTNEVFCDVDHDEGAPNHVNFPDTNGVVTTILSPANDALDCIWFVTTWVGDVEGGPDTLVATEGGDTAELAPAGQATDLAVASGTITIEARWCPSGSNEVDFTTATLSDLMDACQEAGYDVAFTLDLGYWSGAQSIGEVIPGGVYWEPPLSPDPIAIYGPAGESFYQKVYCANNSPDVGKPDYAEVALVGDAISAVLTTTSDNLYCAWFLTPIIAGLETDGGATALALPPRPEEHPGHCPEGYAWELLLHEDERGNLTWLYGCVWVGDNNPTGPDDATGGNGGTGSPPGNRCPEGYVLKLLLRENADGSLTWLYGCVPGDSGPTGPIDETGTGGDGGGSDSPRIVPATVLTSTEGGHGGPDDGGDGNDGCPAGHYWTNGPIYFPNWPVDTDGDGYLDATDTVVVYGGCVPASGECPEGSAIHPYYTEYGCIKYGYGPWAT